MLRLALTAYLSVMTLLAPCLCCCTVSATLAWFAPAEEVSAPAQHHGCSCGHSKPETASKRSDKSEQPPCDDHPCSAKQHSSMPAVLSPDGDDVSLLHFADAGHQNQNLVIQVAPPAVFVAPVALEGNCNFPRLTGREILRAIQILRC